MVKSPDLGRCYFSVFLSGGLINHEVPKTSERVLRRMQVNDMRAALTRTEMGWMHGTSQILQTGRRADTGIENAQAKTYRHHS
jgi:hypothetical protein